MTMTRLTCLAGLVLPLVGEWDRASKAICDFYPVVYKSVVDPDVHNKVT